ncbi:unnamed protein product [Rotaria sp. Silwood1]|nr:unnamed protein product [Rotaria sp. Silwood1]
MGTHNGTTITRGNGQGDATNQLNRPNDLFVGDDQAMVIADSGNRRISQWKMDDTNGPVVSGGHGEGN